VSGRPADVWIDRVAVRRVDVPNPSTFAERFGRELTRALAGWTPVADRSADRVAVSLDRSPVGDPAGAAARGVAAQLRGGETR
jgi:hypothetical protein